MSNVVSLKDYRAKRETEEIFARVEKEAARYLDYVETLTTDEAYALLNEAMASGRGMQTYINEILAEKNR